MFGYVYFFRNIFACLILNVVVLNCYAQLKVDQYGRIGMGTNYPNTSYKCHIKGDLLLTTYPEIIAPATFPIELRFKVGIPLIGSFAASVEIGTNSDKIAFYSTETNFNNLYAQSFIVLSDSLSKMNFKPIDNSLEKILKLKTYTDQFTEKNATDRSFRYGFISQQVERVLGKEVKIVEDMYDAKMMDYNQIIPLLVGAVQEQQKIIDSLIIVIKNNGDNGNPLVRGESRSILYQNKPNPFSEQTIIEYDIAEKFNKCEIVVFDLTGKMLKSFLIKDLGRGKLTIERSEFSKGIYLYSLIIDNNEIASKRMLITE